jgi:hypothetical protein
MRLTLLTIALSVAVAGSAQAQQLKLAFNAGHVSVDATSVPVRTILAEWSKLGGTKVVGAERIAGAPLTLKLVDMPESQALEIILRNVAGYMAAPRVADAGTASMYDRILVLATSSAPPSTTAARPNTSAPGPNAGIQRFIPRAVVQPADEDNEPEEEPERPNQPVFTFPQPGQNGFPQPGSFGPQGAVMPSGISTNPNANGPVTITINPTGPPTAPPAATPAPNGFGVVGAPTPGMIQQPVQPPGQPAQPGPMVRPPGA